MSAEFIKNALKELPNEDAEISTREVEEEISKFVGEEEIISYYVAKNLPKNIESQFKPLMENLITEIYFLTKESIISYAISSNSKVLNITKLDDVKVISFFDEGDLLTILLAKTTTDFVVFGSFEDKEKIESFFKRIKEVIEG